MTGRALAVVAELGADLQPAGWRLTERAGHRPPPGPQPARPGPRHARGAGAGLHRHVQGPGRRTVDAGRDRRAAARRQGARRLRRPPRAGPGAGRGADRPRRRPTPPAAGRGPAGRPGRRARADRGAGGRRCRPRPASAGTARSHPPEASQALGWVLDAITDGGRRAVGALLRRRHAARPAPRRRRARALGRPRPSSRPATTTSSAAALEAGRDRRARRRAVDRPGHATRPTARSPRRCCAGWRCSASTRTQVGDRLVLTPACGLAGATPAWARTALDLVRRAAAQVDG